MDAFIYEYPCGLRLVYKKMPYVHSVSVGVLTGVGSGNETVKNNGISHFIEHMLFKGTQKRSAFEIVDYIDGLGAQINAFTSKQTTCFYTLSIDEQAEQCAEVLSDLLFNSTFDPEETEREKGVVLEEISMTEDDNADLSLDLMAEAYFDGNPLAMTILGTRDNVKGFTRKDITDYIADNYCASDTVVSIVGNIDADKANDIVGRYFAGRFTDNKDRRWQDVAHVTAPRCITRFKDIEQSNISIGTPCVEYGSDLEMASMLLNNVVGGGMSSRLFQQIREVQGLAYNVYTYPSGYINNGIMTLYIGTNPSSVDKAIIAARGIIDDLRKNGISAREFEKGKQQLKGAYIIGQESCGALMRLYAKNALFADELFDFDKKIAAIDKVSEAQVKKCIDLTFDPSKASIGFVGKESKSDLLSLYLG